jgi:head-tail adaptor
VADLLAASEKWLAGVFRDSAAVGATYRRAALSAAVSLTLGGPVQAAYGNAPVPAAAVLAHLPAAQLVLGGVTAAPQSGDLLAWPEAGGTTPRVLLLGPWGPDRAVARRVEDGWTWEVYGQEPGLIAGRKTTLVELQRPKATGLTRNEYGETDQASRFEAAQVTKAEVTPLSAAEDVEAGRLAELSKYLVFVTTPKPVTSAWRVKVRDGVLRGRLLYVETVTPLPGYAAELMLVCRLAGG